jgi:hypothetical protein
VHDLWVVRRPRPLGQVDGSLFEPDRIADALEIVQGGELDEHLALALAELDPHPSLQAVRESLSQVRHAGGLHGRPDSNPGPLVGTKQRLAVLDPLGKLLGHPDCQTFGHDPIGETLLLHRILQRGNGARVTRRQRPGCDSPLHTPREAKKAHGVGDHGPAPSQARRQLLLCDPEVQQELLVRGRFLQRVQVLTMHVFEERIAEHLIVLGGADDGGDPLQSCCSRRADSPLPHHDLIALAAGPNHDRLENADRLNAGCQLLQRLLVEGPTRLTRIGIDSIKGKLLERRP